MTFRSLASAQALATAFLVLAATPQRAGAAPAFVCVTPTHRIEVEAAGSNDTYDYRSWRLNKPGDGPALTLRGSMEVQGTGACRTRYWTFKNGKYEYVIADSANCGEQAPPAGATGQLIVSLSGKEISQSWCHDGSVQSSSVQPPVRQDSAVTERDVPVISGSSPPVASTAPNPAYAPNELNGSVTPAASKPPVHESVPTPAVRIPDAPPESAVVSKESGQKRQDAAPINYLAWVNFILPGGLVVPLIACVVGTIAMLASRKRFGLMRSNFLGVIVAVGIISVWMIAGRFPRNLDSGDTPVASSLASSSERIGGPFDEMHELFCKDRKRKLNYSETIRLAELVGEQQRLTMKAMQTEDVQMAQKLTLQAAKAVNPETCS